MNQFYTANDHFVLVPAIMLALFGCAILLLDTWVFPNPRHRKWLLVVFVIPGLALTAFAFWRQQAYLDSSGIAALISSRTATAGMIAKLRACEHALANGVDEVLIVDGRNEMTMRAALGGVVPRAATRIVAAVEQRVGACG